MRKIKRFSIFLPLVVFLNTLFAQKSETGNWFIYFGNQPINKKWNWWNEVQYRNYNFAGDLQQLLLRTGIGYNLSENNNNILFGYAFINSQRYGLNSEEKIGTNEHRLYLQFITRHAIGRLFVQHRFRAEGRFLSSDFGGRMRYFLAVNLPLNHKTMTSKTVYLSAYNELFVNVETPVFDRNRLYGALGYVFNKSFRIEAGFMAQTLKNTSRNQFQIVLFNNLSFRKNQ